MDSRISLLANNLVHHSISLMPGEKVYVDYFGTAANSLVEKLIQTIYENGGIPFLHLNNSQLFSQILMYCTEEQIALTSSLALQEMKQMDCYIRIKADDNINELSDVPSEKLAIYQKYFYSIVHLSQRVCHTKWVVLKYPTANLAQAASMSTSSFEDFFFKVCTMDYQKLHSAMLPLKDLMEKTSMVHITGPGTDLAFSIEGINCVACYGKRNIPDGEVYTAPVRNSINGVISYNAPSIFNSYTFENIRFEFKNGKIIKATANNSKLLNEFINCDEGARYIGEFSLGVNPFVNKPMKDILFDEKIAGSFHLTPGNCYTSAPNGNKSSIHWDLVCIQTPEFGGGEIYFDNTLIRKDGLFVHPDLVGLNPENFI